MKSRASRRASIGGFPAETEGFSTPLSNNWEVACRRLQECSIGLVFPCAEQESQPQWYTWREKQAQPVSDVRIKRRTQSADSLLQQKLLSQDRVTFSPLFAAWLQLPAGAAALWDLPRATHRWRCGRGTSALSEITKGRIIKLCFWISQLNELVNRIQRQGGNI